MKIEFGENHQTTFTAVDNQFISKYMLPAPGDYVKVYLYLLWMYNQGNGRETQDVVKALGVQDELFMEAVDYWEKRGLLQAEKSDGLKVHFLDASAAREGTLPVYHYGEFNARIAAIMAPREVKGTELAKMYDWIEVYGIEQGAVLLLVKYCLDTAGPKTSINYMHKMAKTWSEQGIFTAEKAKEALALDTMIHSDARHILKHIGIFRLPSKDELELVEKWRKEWGFTLDAILATCREMTRVQKPNFNYLDKVLKTNYEAGRTSAKAVMEHTVQRDTSQQQLGEVLFHLGSRAAVTPALVQTYKQWLEQGFDYQAILSAADSCAKQGRSSVAYLAGKIEMYYNQGLLSAQDIEKFQQQEKLLDEDIKIVFERLGLDSKIEPFHRNSYLKWKKMGMPFEVILLSAEFSSLAKNKFANMDRLLTAWNDASVRTVAKAKAYQEQAKKQSGNEKPKFDYSQREYSEEELMDLFDNK